MLQIVNVTDARNNLGKLVQNVRDNKKPVIILQDSFPSVVLYPYDEFFQLESQKNIQFKLEFSNLKKTGNKSFKQYLKIKNIPYPKSEDQAYSIIKNA